MAPIAPLQGMFPRVEPEQGPESERLITALLNATGAIHQLMADAEGARTFDGLAIIEAVAERLRAILAVQAEHHSDAELELVTGVLAEATLLVAADLGLIDTFLED